MPDDVSVTLNEQGVPGWLAEAVGRLARGDRHTLDGLLVTVGEPLTFENTRATCRTHFVARDGNGRPRVTPLANRLAERAVDYCIPRSRIEDAQRHLVETGSTERFLRLSSEATELFTKLEKSGEGGELLLYTLLEVILGVPQILCKMPLKTSEQMHVHGTDGVHAQILENGSLALYWGESKLHASVNSAIDDCFKSISPFLLDEGDGASRRDLLLVRDHLDAGEQELTARLIKYFDEDAPESAMVEVRAACLVGFDMDDYPDPFDESGRAVHDAVQTAIGRWQSRVHQNVRTLSLETFEIEVFCVPMPSVDKFRAAMRRKLRLT